MQLTPYLTFNGDSEAAFRFYAECLGWLTATARSEPAGASWLAPAYWGEFLTAFYPSSRSGAGVFGFCVEGDERVRGRFVHRVDEGFE